MASGSATLEDMFALFSKFGDSKSDGKTITLSQSDKWMKQAGVLDKKITTTDTGICFSKLKSKNLGFKEYDTFLQELAKYKNVNYNEIVQKMITCGTPGTSNATQAVKVGGVDRLTDTSKYTGTHKERFDESGKGKGKEGRVDESQNTGYVQGYANKDTYDKTHK